MDFYYHNLIFLFESLLLFPKELDSVIIEYLRPIPHNEKFIDLLEYNQEIGYINTIKNSILYSFNLRENKIILQKCDIKGKQKLNKINTFDNVYCMDGKVYVHKQTLKGAQLYKFNKECVHEYTVNIDTKITCMTQAHNKLYMCSSQHIYMMDSEEKITKYTFVQPQMHVYKINVFNDNVYLHVECVRSSRISSKSESLYFSSDSIIKQLDNTIDRVNNLIVIDEEVYVLNIPETILNLTIITVYDLNMSYVRTFYKNYSNITGMVYDAPYLYLIVDHSDMYVYEITKCKI